MKRESGIVKISSYLLCLAAIAVGSGSVFFFTGGELFGGGPESRFWSNYFSDGKFVHRKGIIYLDRLERTIEYRMDISLEIQGGFEPNPPFVDRKNIPYKCTKQDITPNGGKIRSKYLISFIIPVSDKNSAVIKLPVSRVLTVNKNPKTDYVSIKSARIESMDKGHETGHLLLISLISTAIGAAFLFVIKKIKPDNQTAFLFAASSVMSTVFLFNSFSFRYVYAVFKRPLPVYIFFTVIIAFLTIGIFRAFKTEDDTDGSSSSEKNSRKPTVQKKPSQEQIWKNSNERKKDIFAYLALLFLFVGIFSYNFGNDFVSDDFFLLHHYEAKELLNTFSGPSDPFGCCPKYYRPFSVVYFQLQHSLFGDCYPLYYLLRFFHFYFNCVLLYMLLKKIGLRPSSSLAGAAFLAASAYSSIAAGWLSSAYDVLMITFILLAVHFRMDRGKKANFILSYLCFIAALLTKEPAVVIPFFLIVLDLILNRKWKRNDFLFHAVCLITLVFYFIYRTYLFGGLAGMEQKHYFFSFSNLPTIMNRVVETFYLMFIKPGGGLVQYSKAVDISSLCWPLLMAISTAACVASFLRRKNGVFAGNVKVLLIGVLWILLFLLPIIFPFDFYRLAYILIPGAAITIAALLDILRLSPLPRLLKTAAVLLFVLALAHQSIRSLQIGYNRLGKGSLNRFNVNVSELETWDKNLPVEIKNIWKKKLYERK